jgi:hypothetical protein
MNSRIRRHWGFREHISIAVGEQGSGGAKADQRTLNETEEMDRPS